MKRFLTIIISLLLINCGISQTLEQTYALANSQFEKGSYDFAINSYQRLLFFDNERKYPDSYIYLGDSYFGLSDYSHAAQYYDLAYFAVQNDSLKKEVSFRKISCLLIQQHYALAKAELLSLPDALTEYFQQKKDFYAGVCYFGTNEFELSEQHFMRCVDSTNTVARQQLEEQFKKLGKVNRINPKVAKLLSVFLPGAGQLYSGDLKNSINSFLLNSAFVVLFVVTAQNYSLIDAIISVLPWFERYYVGGIQHAGKIANERINYKRNIVYRKIIDILASQKK